MLKLQKKNNLLDLISLTKSFSPIIDDYDLYLILAGTLGNEQLARKDTVEATKITSINYLGVIMWLNSIMTEEGSKNGSLWVFSSVAGDLGRPSNYHYGAAKSALTTYNEGLMARCFKPFKVRIIKPGYIYTRKTKKIARFLCTTPKKVAKILFKTRNKEGIQYIPYWWNLLCLSSKNYHYP